MTLEEQTYNIAEFAFEHGEILKAYHLLTNAPLIVRDDKKLSQLFDRVKQRLDIISGFQTKGRVGSGFSDPDTNTYEPYLLLKFWLQRQKDIKTLLDVGCYSGWIGRNLSSLGYSVHGIDLDRETLEVAKYYATGTNATYEVLEGTKVGEKYPDKFDGAIMFDVVEHLFDDRLLLNSVERAVRTGGVIFINLPKYDNQAQLDQGNIPDDIKEHLRAYSDKEVEDIFKDKKVFVNEVIKIPSSSYFIGYTK